jgi:hypothetical protein
MAGLRSDELFQGNAALTVAEGRDLEANPYGCPTPPVTNKTTLDVEENRPKAAPHPSPMRFPEGGPRNELS